MSNSRYKLFLSHASEDKLAIADVLAKALKGDFDVWYDDYKLVLGDSLLNKINEGLREADYGVVILSRIFFEKYWTRNELDGLFALEEANRKVIIPVWHGIGVEDVKAYSPILAGRVGISSTEGISSIVAAIHLAVDAANRTAEFDVTASIPRRLLKIDDELEIKKRNKQLLNGAEGIKLVLDAAGRCIERLLQSVEDLGKIVGRLKFVTGSLVHRPTLRSITVEMPYSLALVITYFNSIGNSAERGCLSVKLDRNQRNMLGEISGQINVIHRQFYPMILDDNEVLWKDKEVKLNENQMTTFLLDLMVWEVEKAHKASEQDRQ